MRSKFEMKPNLVAWKRNCGSFLCLKWEYHGNFSTVQFWETNFVSSNSAKFKECLKTGFTFVIDPILINNWHWSETVRCLGFIVPPNVWRMTNIA